MAGVYTQQNYDQFLMDGDSKIVNKQIYKIRDLPLDEKPRERLIKYGASLLSVPELLAVLLNVGTKKEDVLSMATRVLNEYGERSLVSQKNPKTLAKDLDIPLGKATQIIACAELGRRFFQRNGAGVSVIRTAQDVFDYVSDMRGLPKEHLRGLYLNAHHKIIHDEVISIGTVNANIIHPREVFKPAIEYAAAAFILVHNHPSGVTKPSTADIEVTKRLIETANIVGIDLLDHVIVTKNKFTSVPVDYK